MNVKFSLDIEFNKFIFINRTFTYTKDFNFSEIFIFIIN